MFAPPHAQLFCALARTHAEARCSDWTRANSGSGIVRVWQLEINHSCRSIMNKLCCSPRSFLDADKDRGASADGPGTAPSGQSLPAPTTNGTGHSPQQPGSAPADGAPAPDGPTAAAAAAGPDGEQRKDVTRTPAEEDALLARAQTIRVRPYTRARHNVSVPDAMV